MAGSKRIRRKRAVSSKQAQHARQMTWIKRIIAIAIIALAGGLLYHTLSGYSLDEIIDSIQAIPLPRLAFAGMFAAASYYCLTWFDFMAVRYAGKAIPYHRCALASFCSLSLGHNIGFAALSSGAIRYRFYTRWGMTAGQIAKIIIFCGVTVGLGLITLAGIALLLRPDLGAKITGFTPGIAMTIGAACVAASALYLLASVFVRGEMTIKNWSLTMPDTKFAAAQIAVGSANFACVAGCLHQTLSAAGDLQYLAVAAAYVIANASALLTHVPGGLGVIESVVMFLLPGAKIVGALVMFRVIYFLVPLSIGAPLFGLTEIFYRGKRRREAG